MTTHERPHLHLGVHDHSSGWVVAMAAVGILVVIALIGAAAIVGVGLMLNSDNPPATQPAPTVAPAPTEQLPLPIPGFDLYPNMSGAS